MIGPVYHVVRGDTVDLVDLCVGIFGDISIAVILNDIVGGVDIHSAVILHDTRVSSESLGKQRVIFPFCFIAGSWRNSGKQLFHCCCIHYFFCNRKFCDFSQQIILNQLEVCTVYAAALVYVCCQTCCIAGECTGNALSCQCQIHAVNDTVCIDIAQMKRLGFPCTEDRRSAHSTDRLVQIEVICTFCGFHIQHHIRGICWNLIVFVGKLYPLTLDGSSLCHGGVLCLAVGIGICQFQEKLVGCIAIKVFHVNAKAVFFSRHKHLGIQCSSGTIPRSRPILHQQCFTAHIGGSAAGENICTASAFPAVCIALKCALEIPAVFIRFNGFVIAAGVAAVAPLRLGDHRGQCGICQLRLMIGIIQQRGVLRFDPCVGIVRPPDAHGGHSAV